MAALPQTQLTDTPATMRPLDVVFVHRRPQATNFSLERLFAEIRAALPDDINARVWQCPFVSRGLFGRLGNMAAASVNQGTVTHITGDVHYVAIPLHGARTILTVPDIGTLHRLRGWKRRVMKRLWYQLPMARVAIVTTISDFVRQELIDSTGCPPDKVVTVHVPIGSHFRRAPRPFNATCPRILMIGSAWNKNLVRQTEALAGIPCHIDYIGTPSAEHQGALDRSGLSYTVSSGLSDQEVLDRYVACDVVMFASLYEGFGMPIIEANVVGRPVITSTTASMPEVAGDAACLVDPESVQAIRSGVLRVLGDTAYRENLVERGYLNAKRFSAERIAARFAELYRSLAPR